MMIVSTVFVEVERLNQRSDHLVKPWTIIALRFFIGSSLGGILSFIAFVLAGWGHGILSPVLFNVPLKLKLLDSIPGLYISSFFAAPVLWGSYFAFLPEFRRALVRRTSTAIILAIHLLAGFQQAFAEMETIQQFARHQTFYFVFYFFYLFVLLIACGLLILFGFRHPQDINAGTPDLEL